MEPASRSPPLHPPPFFPLPFGRGNDDGDSQDGGKGLLPPLAEERKSDRAAEANLAPDAPDAAEGGEEHPPQARHPEP
jgi:hypothetical protein